MISDTIRTFLTLREAGHARYEVTNDGRLVMYKNRYCPDNGCLIREEVLRTTTEAEVLAEIADIDSMKAAAESLLALAYP